MAQYALKRVAALVPVLFVVSVVVFLLIHLMPGDPARVLLGPDAPESAVDLMRDQLGLNQPLVVQYFSWLGDVLLGDLGESLFIQKPVTEILVQAFGPTMSLALLGQCIAILVAIPAGVLAARYRGTLIDQAVMASSMLGISLPSFLLGLFMMLLFGVQLQILPTAGFSPLSDGLGEHLRYLIMPAVALGAMQAALIARMTRTSMLEVYSQNYMKTAKAKGLNDALQIFKHALKNAALPILTTIGQSFGVLIAGAVVVETVFNIPGIGQLVVNSIERRDFVVIQGVVLLIAVLYVVINLIVDLLYSVLDPRVRFE